MAGLRDMIRRALGGQNPEAALAAFKEKLHAQINDFKDNPHSRARLKQTLNSILRPLQYANSFVIRPSLADNQKMREMAQKYGINKVELKRIFKTSVELEDKLQRYFKDDDQADQLIVTLRKVINVLDEQVLAEMVDALDYHIDYGKIEKAYLDYQTNIQRAYNIEGLNAELKNIMGGLFSNFKDAFQNNKVVSKTRPSDQEPEARMLEPELQTLYDRFREEGFSHQESMDQVTEKQDLDRLSESERELYRTRRQQGLSHSESIQKMKDEPPATQNP